MRRGVLESKPNYSPLRSAVLALSLSLQAIFRNKDETFGLAGSLPGEVCSQLFDILIRQRFRQGRHHGIGTAASLIVL